MALERQVECGIQQRVAGVGEGRQGLARRRDEGFFAGDALVTWKRRLTDTNEVVAVADGRRDVGHLIAARFPLAGRPPKLLQGFESAHR